MLSRRSDRLVVDALILTAALTTDIGEVGIAHQLAREHHDLMTDAKRRLHSDHELDPQLVAFAIERLLRSRAPRAQPVPLEQEWQLPLQFPEEGMGAEAALAHIGDLALDGAAQLYHPGYFAHMDPPTATVTSLAALWQATANQNLLHPDAAPAARALEQRVIEWLAPCFGMGGGHLVPGSTIATFTAIWAARELRGVRRVVASERAHLSARKAADILGLGYQPVPSDVTHRMLSAELGDLSDAALVVTAGTVATGAIDALDVSGAGWLHVDGAWGG
ncbi:MAG: L-2,4-diaminobutyrate decarboxylase, partial [Gammaproteobacteria bacterium]